MPCGGAIDIEISLKRKIVEVKKGIESFGRIIINNPEVGARYYIKIITTYKDELTKQSGVEVSLVNRKLAISNDLFFISYIVQQNLIQLYHFQLCHSNYQLKNMYR